MDTPSPEVLAIGDAVVTTIKKNLPNIGATLLAVGVVLGIWSISEMEIGLRIAFTAIAAALLVFFYAKKSDVAMSGAAHPVGSLSDVVAALGEQLRAAHEAERPYGTIIFSSAEVELSVTTETAHDGSVSFKVIEGGTMRQSGETSTLRVQLSPTAESFEIGQ